MDAVVFAMDPRSLPRALEIARKEGATLVLSHSTADPRVFRRILEEYESAKVCYYCAKERGYKPTLEERRRHFLTFLQQRRLIDRAKKVYVVISEDEIWYEKYGERINVLRELFATLHSCDPERRIKVSKVEPRDMAGLISDIVVFDDDGLEIFFIVIR